MDEVFPNRCMVPPNEVEETRVWIDLAANIILISVRHMKNKICLGIERSI